METTTKYCSMCDKEKPVDEFNKDNNRKDKLYPYCGSCARRKAKEAYRKQGYKTQQKYYQKHRKKKIAYSKEYRKRNPGCRRREQFLTMSKKTGLSPEQIENFYNRQFKKQQGKCAICGIHQTLLNKSLCIDHCHETNKLRGLLCYNCNLACGNFQDDAELCIKAYEYLRRT